MPGKSADVKSPIFFPDVWYRGMGSIQGSWEIVPGSLNNLSRSASSPGYLSTECSLYVVNVAIPDSIESAYEVHYLSPVPMGCCLSLFATALKTLGGTSSYT